MVRFILKRFEFFKIKIIKQKKNNKGKEYEDIENPPEKTNKNNKESSILKKSSLFLVLFLFVFFLEIAHWADRSIAMGFCKINPHIDCTGMHVNLYCALLLAACFFIVTIKLSILL